MGFYTFFLRCEPYINAHMERSMAVWGKRNGRNPHPGRYSEDQKNLTQCWDPGNSPKPQRGWKARGDLSV